LIAFLHKLEGLVEISQGDIKDRVPEGRDVLRIRKRLQLLEDGERLLTLTKETMQVAKNDQLPNPIPGKREQPLNRNIRYFKEPTVQIGNAEIKVSRG
jgi:hypothetical protein